MFQKSTIQKVATSKEMVASVFCSSASSTQRDLNLGWLIGDFWNPGWFGCQWTNTGWNHGDFWSLVDWFRDYHDALQGFGYEEYGDIGDEWWIVDELGDCTNQD